MHRPRLWSTLQFLLLGLLMLGVLVKPVIALAGEVHEAEHALIAGDASHAEHDSPELLDPLDTPDSGNPLHAFLHFADCCGPSAALLPLSTPASVSLASSEPLPCLSVELPPAANPVALRPPITT